MEEGSKGQRLRNYFPSCLWKLYFWGKKKRNSQDKHKLRVQIKLFRSSFMAPTSHWLSTALTDWDRRVSFASSVASFNGLSLTAAAFFPGNYLIHLSSLKGNFGIYLNSTPLVWLLINQRLKCSSNCSSVQRRTNVFYMQSYWLL